MDVLLVVGSKASYVHTVYTMHQSMNRERTTLLVVDGVGDVVSEAVRSDSIIVVQNCVRACSQTS